MEVFEIAWGRKAGGQGLVHQSQSYFAGCNLKVHRIPLKWIACNAAATDCRMTAQGELVLENNVYDEGVIHHDWASN